MYLSCLQPAVSHSTLLTRMRILFTSQSDQPGNVSQSLFLDFACLVVVSGSVRSELAVCWSAGDLQCVTHVLNMLCKIFRDYDWPLTTSPVSNFKSP